MSVVLPTYLFCEGFLGFWILIDSCHEHFAFELYDGFLIPGRSLTEQHGLDILYLFILSTPWA